MSKELKEQPMTYTAQLTLIKGSEITIEELISPEDDEISESEYEVMNARFYITIEEEEHEIDTDSEVTLSEDAVELTEEQYVKVVGWRTCDWTLTSERAITPNDVQLITRTFGEICFVSFKTSDDVDCEFDSAWDGRYSEVLQEAANPTYSNTDDC